MAEPVTSSDPAVVVEDALRSLEDARLLRPTAEPEWTLIFNHVLVQETAYQSILVKRRRELHRQVASAYEREFATRLDDYVPTLAYHYWHAEDWQEAASYARRAGERASRLVALREAIVYFAQALEAIGKVQNPSPEETCDIILGWAGAAFGFEPFPKILLQIERAEQIARQAGDKRRLALALHMIGKANVAAGHPMLAGEALAECYELATQLGDQYLAALPTFAMGMAAIDTDPRQALSYFDKAVELSRNIGDVDIEAYALSAKAMTLSRLGENAKCRQSITEALQVVDHVKSPMTDSDVHLYSAWALLDLGETQRGLDQAKIGVQKAVSADNVECACFGFACLGFSYLRVEEMKEATEAFEEAIRRSRISGADEAQLLGESGLGMVHLSSGDPGAINELMGALARAREKGKEFPSALLSLTLGEISLKSGDPEKALAYLDDALAYYRRNSMRPYLVRTLALSTSAWEQRGDTTKVDQARQELAALNAYEDAFP